MRVRARVSISIDRRVLISYNDYHLTIDRVSRSLLSKVQFARREKIDHRDGPASGEKNRSGTIFRSPSPRKRARVQRTSEEERRQRLSEISARDVADRLGIASS